MHNGLYILQSLAQLKHLSLRWMDKQKIRNTPLAKYTWMARPCYATALTDPKMARDSFSLTPIQQSFACALLEVRQ